MATNNLSLWFLGTGFLTGIITLILLFTTTTKKARKAKISMLSRIKHSRQKTGNR